MELKFTPEVTRVLRELQAPNWKVKLKEVNETLARLENNPRYPGLNSHKYESISSTDGSDVWESYVGNQTPGAWRIFWQYGLGRDVLTIGPHPA